MKTKLTLLLMLTAFAVNAQTTYLKYTLDVTTNFPAASGITSFGTATNVVDLTMYEKFSVTATFKGTNAGNSSAVGYYFITSPDGTNWDTSHKYYFSVTASDTATIQASTNFNVAQFSHIKPLLFTNANGNDLTNHFVWITLKGYARDR